MAKKEFPKTPVKFILHFLKPYLWYFLGLLFIAFLWAVDTSLEPYLIKIILDILEKVPKEEPNLLAYLKEPVLIYIFLRAFMNLIDRLHDYLSLKIIPHFNKNIRGCPR